ncbi:hypothetical protein J2W42_001132 [Rhizobium tibeticum]|uniref:hypothetical protein n=1 Tax=Rhizobium tibeticum TaxID=501024 RepID=UPI00277D42C6|nr:hypothetical protein [Rhizobium tibeticum]MDP9808294.1 hypothetical protein [Rhizobium tibeticum]
MSAERGFGLLQRSADKLAPPLAHEIERLAVRGWGSKPDLADYAVDSIGHFRSREDPSRMHVLCVRPLPGYQPVRAVVTLPLGDYLRHACNPFAFARAGFFDFVDAFLADPSASGFCAPAAGPLSTDDPAPSGQARWRDAALAALIGPLLAGRSTILKTLDASAASTVIEEVSWAMPIELRSRVTLLSFAYSDAGVLKAFAPALACVIDAAGATPGPGEDYGSADAAGLSAVLAARRARQAALSIAPEDRTANLYERLFDLERRLEEQKAYPAPPVEAAAVGQVEQVELRSDPPPAARDEDDGDRGKARLQRWRPLVGGLALVGIAGIAGYVSLSRSLSEFEKRVGVVEQGRSAISQRLSALEASSGTLPQRLANLEAADGAASTRLATLEEQWNDLVASLASDPDPAAVPERLRQLKERVDELIAALGLPPGADPATLLGTVEQLADLAASLTAKVAAATTAFAAAEQALVAPLQALPKSGMALGNQMIVTWATDAESGLVTFEARRRPVDGDTAPASRLRITVDGVPGKAIAVDDRNNRLRLSASDGTNPLEVTTLRVKVGAVQTEMLSITVATLSQADPAAGRLVRVLGIVPQ